MTRLSFAVTDAVELDEEIEIALSQLDEQSINSPIVTSMKGQNLEIDQKFDLAHETWLLFSIAIPAVAVQFSVLFIFTLTASTVGLQLGTEELAGFSLASLTGNLTILSVMVGALTAADTLMPRAFGTKRYEEVGRLAVRGFVMCSILLIPPVIPLYTAMDWVFEKLGQDPVASALASQWIRVYLLGVPAMLVFRVAQSFLNSQHVVMPLVTASLISCFLLHPILLKAIVPAFGFVGSGVAVTLTQTFMAIIVFSYVFIWPEYHPQTWPGISMKFVKDSLRPKPVKEFLHLSLGGVLSLSEWWFWETNCFIVGSFGIVPLCVHTIAYNLVPLLFMIPLGICIGLQVRMGTVLALDVPRAKKMAAWCMGFTTVLGAVVSSVLYVMRVPIVLLFSKDEKVLQGCVDIWPKLCVYIFILYIFGINSAILRSLGMQWQMAAIIFGTCWCGALPTIVYFSIYRGGGLDAIWSILPVWYTAMQVLLVLCYTVFCDWNKIGLAIRQEHVRRHSSAGVDLKFDAEAVVAREETPLL
jgi:MATE family multidrug resistance protein